MGLAKLRQPFPRRVALELCFHQKLTQSCPFSKKIKNEPKAEGLGERILGERIVFNLSGMLWNRFSEMSFLRILIFSIEFLIDRFLFGDSGRRKSMSLGY